ncbi:MAG: hypothetical protein ACK6A8_05015 [Planctomycetota bacterium]
MGKLFELFLDNCFWTGHAFVLSIGTYSAFGQAHLDKRIWTGKWLGEAMARAGVWNLVFPDISSATKIEIVLKHENREKPCIQA